MKKLFIILISALSFSSCYMSDDFTKENSPTTGKLVLFYDEGLKLHIENQINTFKSIYGYADIELVSSDERSCVEALFNDSCKAIAISRPLSESELQKFLQKNIRPESSVVAKNAIAFVVNKDFADSTLSMSEILALLQGNDSTLIKGKHIKIVFDNQNSGSTRHLKDSLLPNTGFGKNCSAVNNTKELIKTISADVNAIGVCDYAWLSDKDDNTTKEFLKTIKILAVSKTNTEIAYMPDQSNLATLQYPLIRSICIIRRSSEFSLGKGVETFIAGPQGQLMFLKQGLAPNRQEERVIEITIPPVAQPTKN